jgi:hypothetical protein
MNVFIVHIYTLFIPLLIIFKKVVLKLRGIFMMIILKDVVLLTSLIKGLVIVQDSDHLHHYHHQQLQRNSGAIMLEIKKKQ